MCIFLTTSLILFSYRKCFYCHPDIWKEGYTDCDIIWQNCCLPKPKRTALSYSSRLTSGPLPPFFFIIILLTQNIHCLESKISIYRSQYHVPFTYLFIPVSSTFQYKWVNCIHCKLLLVYISHCYNDWKMVLTLFNRASRVLSNIL